MSSPSPLPKRPKGKKYKKKVKGNIKITNNNKTNQKGRNLSKDIKMSREKVPKTFVDVVPVKGNKTIGHGQKGLGFSIPNEADSCVTTNKMIVPIEFSNEQLVIAIYTYISRMMYLGNISSYINTTKDVSGYLECYQGMSYLYAAMITFSSGGMIEATEMPRIFAVMSKLLTQKVVRFSGGGVIQYTPTWAIPNPELQATLTTPTGSFFTLAEPDENFDITMPVAPYTGTVAQYTQFLKMGGTETNFGMQLVSVESEHGLFERDPSSYARNYTYFGSAGSNVGGVYSEAEMEVPFFYPYFSKFVQYDTKDSVISRVFHPTSGGLNTPVGLACSVDKFTYSDLKNPIPVVYKFLDFNQVYAEIGSWLVGLFDSVPPNITGNNVYTQPTQLTMTSQEFRLALRQALLSNFPEQAQAQFMAPVRTTNNSSSIFQPFIVDSVGVPMNAANQMIIPSYITENLSMLRSVNTKIFQTKGSAVHHNTPQKLSQNWIPVWGVYSQDLPPEFTFTNADGAEVNLFSTAPTYPECNLWDLVSHDNSTKKIQINNFVPNIISAWNSQIIGFSANKSTKTGPLQTDRPRVSLLHYTRILKSFLDDSKKPTEKQVTLPQIKNPADNFIYNKPGAKHKKMIITPSTYYNLYTDTILSHTALPTDIVAGMRFFILPSIRLEYTDGDLLTLNAYQIYTGEICSVNSTTGNVSNSDAEVYRLFNIGVTLMTGLFAGSDTNNTIVNAIQTLVNFGQGADFLKSLLGGLSSLIPVVGPVLSNLIGS